MAYNPYLRPIIPMQCFYGPEMSSNVIQLNAQFCTDGEYLHAIANTLTYHYYRFKYAGDTDPAAGPINRRLLVRLPDK